MVPLSHPALQNYLTTCVDCLARAEPGRPIFILGPMATGKTTIASMLVERRHSHRDAPTRTFAGEHSSVLIHEMSLYGFLILDIHPNFGTRRRLVSRLAGLGTLIMCGELVKIPPSLLTNSSLLRTHRITP